MSEGKSETSKKPDEDVVTKSTSKKRDTSWPLVLFVIHLNVLGFYGLIILFTNTSFLTVIFTFLLIFFATMGVTAGAHRLWTHRTYKANSGLRIFLMLCHTLAGNGTIYSWVRSHRLHHQTYKTDDDPFYSNRDFFSAHILAQTQSYNEKQQEMLEKIDMTDIEADKVVMFQKRFYWILYTIFCVLLPVNSPLEYWDDSVPAAIFVTFSLRYLIVLNICWLINSSHFIWGLDKNHKASDSNIIFLVTKSYWPHYHYLLPTDYQTGEFGDYGEGCTTTFIRVCAALGLASDLYTITSDAVKKGLSNSLDSEKSFVDCIKDAANDEMDIMPNDHYLNSTKYL